MPLEPYSGTTFVAFTDISGFKEMMGEERRAVRALDRFYQAAYDTLRRQHGVPRVDGLFVSDSGILFVRGAESEPVAGLRALLEAVEAINRAVLSSEVMLTTSIGHGPFSYHDRLEFPGIEKNPIYGNAYLAAFLDNECGKPKIQPGQCRIMLQQSGEVEDALRALNCPRLRRAGGTKHAYFFWMVSQEDQIPEFERRYRGAYALKYKGMLDALGSAANLPVPRNGEKSLGDA